MPKLKASFILVGALFFCATGFRSCLSLIMDSERDYLANKLATHIQQRRESDKNAIVSLKDVTDFEWDRIYVFPPYTSVKEIHTALGYDWDEAENTGIHMFDSFNLLVFTRAGKVVGYVKYPHTLGDFGGIYEHRKQKGFAPDEAVFMVEVADSPGPPLVLRWQVK